MNDVMTHNEDVERMQSCTINDFCRLCANLDDNMVPIYADEGADHMLENKIKTHLPFINISKNDLLPKRICYHCASAVLVWNELYECSSDADRKLRNMFEASPYDQNQCKNVSYADIEGISVPVKDFIGNSIEYEEITDVTMFNKNEKSDKTLNELDKTPSTSKTDSIINHEDKSPVIQEDERLNPSLKSEISDIFDREDDDSEDHNMYLNAAGMDDDINGLMNCHRLDMSTSDDCALVVPKEEFVDPDEDVDNGCSMDVDQMDHCKNDELQTSAAVDVNHLHHIQHDQQQQQHQPLQRHHRRLRSQQHHHSDDEENVDNDLSSTGVTASSVGGNAAVDEDDMKSEVSSLVDGGDGAVSVGRLIKCEFDLETNGVGGRSSTGASSSSSDDDDDEDDDDDDDSAVVDDDCDPMNVEVRQLYMSSLQDDEAGGGGGRQTSETMCQICATVFKTRYNLLRHFQKRHPEFKMYECDLCRISFPSINEFKDHLEKKHSKVHQTQSIDSKQVRFACDVCGNMYKNKASAMNHLLTHTAKKTVRCQHCEFTCYTKQQLGVHQTKHDKRFVCDICHKRFAQKSQLDVHVNAVHYNQRPFACVLCHKTFKTKGSHDAHMIVHTDTRNYQCPHCDKKCRKRYDLTLHIRTHTGEKPFKCSVCGRGFVQMCDTRKHEMLHFKPGKRKSVFLPASDIAGSTVDDE